MNRNIFSHSREALPSDKRAAIMAPAMRRRIPAASGFGAYMTVEASLVMPLVIATIMFIIFAAFYLYNDCVMAADTYIKCYRAATFTYWQDGYGEVSYTLLDRRGIAEHGDYVASRQDYAKYPFFQLDEEDLPAFHLEQFINEIYYRITVKGRSPSFFIADYPLETTAVTLIPNPVATIRTARRKEKNAAD